MTRLGRPAVSGDYDLRGEDLDQRFARFGLRPLSDADVWALSMAAMVMPDGNPGAEAYLAQVSGTMLFHPRLALWGRAVAIGIAQARYKAPGGVRRRAYVEGYDESWGRYAVADGLSLALYGTAYDAIGKSKDQGYRRIRDFVGGALVNAIAEYRVALEWACGYRRDRVLEGRWEGVTGERWEGMKWEPELPKPEGRRTPRAMDFPDPFTSPHPETLYPGIAVTQWWDESGGAKCGNGSTHENMVGE